MNTFIKFGIGGLIHSLSFRYFAGEQIIALPWANKFYLQLMTAIGCMGLIVKLLDKLESYLRNTTASAQTKKGYGSQIENRNP